MAMSGADGKRFTISKNNLSAAPLGGMMPQMNKILPPLLLGVVLVEWLLHVGEVFERRLKCNKER